jgi:hypothetical protein
MRRREFIAGLGAASSFGVGTKLWYLSILSCQRAVPKSCEIKDSVSAYGLNWIDFQLIAHADTSAVFALAYECGANPNGRNRYANIDHRYDGSRWTILFSRGHAAAEPRFGVDPGVYRRLESPGLSLVRAASIWSRPGNEQIALAAEAR